MPLILGKGYAFLRDGQVPREEVDFGEVAIALMPAKWVTLLKTRSEPNCWCVCSVGLCISESFKNRMHLEQIDNDSVVELAGVPRHIGAPDVNSRAEIADTQGIRQRSAHTDDEGRQLWEMQ